MASFTIHSPLLVFDRVHRSTGTIERFCIVTNHKSEDLDLELDFDFREHSWIQIYGPAVGRHGELGLSRLKLPPGDHRVLLSFNTDNFNFPDSRFSGRITFRDAQNEKSKDWIDISFETVEDLEVFRGYAAIDIGTSSSTVALYHIERDAVRRLPWAPRIAGTSPTIPSAVFIRDFQKFLQHAEGGYLSGEEAYSAYRKRQPRDPRCLQRSTKRLIGAKRVLATDEKGKGGYVDPVEVLYALGKSIRYRTQTHHDVQALLKRVSVTFPPTWSYTQISRWKELFRRLGFREEELDFSLDEASAAGLFYIYNCVRQQDSRNKLLQDLLDSEREIDRGGQSGKCYVLKLLCLDFGGGTIDLAFIEATFEMLARKFRLRLALLGSDSLEFGGDQVTLVIFRILKRRLAMAIADPARMFDEATDRGATAAAPQAVAFEAERHGIGGLQEPEMFLLPDSPAYTSPRISDSVRDLEEERRLISENWGYLAAHAAEPVLDRALEDAIDSLFPTRFFASMDQPCRKDARRNFDWLWDHSEDLKKRLFDEVQRAHGNETFPSLSCLDDIRAGIDLATVQLPELRDQVSFAAESSSGKTLSVGAGEVWRAIAPALREAISRARRMTGEQRADRVLLTGQSCRIPVVRWLLSMPPGEGGLGVPLSHIEFDEENAKAAVSKGACLLNVLRETVVGFEVDIADFKANLLADLFYLEVDGTRRNLFSAGSLDDFVSIEETTEERALPKYLSVFYGSEDSLIGQFLFGTEGEQLPPVPEPAFASSGNGRKTEEIPSHAEFLKLREADRSRYARIASHLLRWSERERIAWMERSAPAGTHQAPRYRYYLTRNHNLFAVRDSGGGTKRLFPLRRAESGGNGLPSAEDAFSGVH